MTVVLEPSVTVRRRGETLPARYYTDPGVLDIELDSVFAGTWLFAGHSCELTAPGDYLLFDLGRDSVIVVRGRDGELRAHHNVCRHRGSRLCAEPRGRVKSFVCPYHQWVYDTDGRLRAAKLMGDDFDREPYRLVAANVRETAGLVFVCLADEPPDFGPAASAVAAQLSAHRLDTARVVHRQTYRVRANWKTLVENNRECYHCPGSHPEFLQTNFDYGMPGDPRGSDEYGRQLASAYERWTADGLNPADVSFPDGADFRVSRLPLRAGFRTESMDGAPVAPPLGEVGTAPGSLRLIFLPTMWTHANLDHAVTTRLTPIEPGLTDVEICYLVAGDAADADVDLERMLEVMTATSVQDFELCEANYAGICSRAYRPGPLSGVVENSVEQFLRWYEQRLESRG